MKRHSSYEKDSMTGSIGEIWRACPPAQTQRGSGRKHAARTLVQEYPSASSSPSRTVQALRLCRDTLTPVGPRVVRSLGCGGTPRDFPYIEESGFACGPIVVEATNPRSRAVHCPPFSPTSPSTETPWRTERARRVRSLPDPVSTYWSAARVPERRVERAEGFRGLRRR